MAHSGRTKEAALGHHEAGCARAIDASYEAG